MENFEDIISQLKKIRVDKNLSQAYIANRLGIKPAQYSNYETGRSDLSLKSFIKILNILDITLDDFFKIKYDLLDSSELDILINLLNKLKNQGKDSAGLKSFFKTSSK